MSVRQQLGVQKSKNVEQTIVKVGQSPLNMQSVS